MEFSIHTLEELAEFNRLDNKHSYETVNLSVNLTSQFHKLFESVDVSPRFDKSYMGFQMYFGVGTIRCYINSGNAEFTINTKRNLRLVRPYNALHLNIPYKELIDAIRYIKKSVTEAEKLQAAAEFAWQMQKNIILQELEDFGIVSNSDLLTVFLDRADAKVKNMYAGFVLYRNTTMKSTKKVKCGDTFVVSLEIHGSSAGVTKIRSIPWASARRMIKAFKD